MCPFEWQRRRTFDGMRAFCVGMQTCNASVQASHTTRLHTLGVLLHAV